MPYGITQCYLPPGRGENPAFTLAEAGTRFSDPEGCKAELTYADRLGIMSIASPAPSGVVAWRSGSVVDLDQRS